MDWLSLFPGSSRDKPRLMALAGAVLRQAEDLVSVIEALQPAFSFAAAEGIQLDSLARSVELDRGDVGADAPDEAFRQYLLAKLALWSWDGTNKTAPAVLNAALPGSRQTDNGDGTVSITGINGEVAGKVIPIPAGTKIIKNEELILNALFPFSRESGDYIIMNCEL